MHCTDSSSKTHNGSHNHHHHHALNLPKDDIKNFRFIIALIVNFLFVLVEIFFGFFSKSNLLVADALHNFGDVIGIAFTWIAVFLLSKSPTIKYSYGYKKVTMLASLLNAVLLMSSSWMILYESIKKLFHVNYVDENIVMIIASCGILVNAGSALFFKNGHGDLNIKSVFYHLLYDALIALGVVFAALMIKLTGWMKIDPITSILVIILIFSSTWNLFKESVDSIIGAVPKNVDYKAVRDYLETIDGVTAIHDLHIWPISTTEIALTAHLVMKKTFLTKQYFDLKKFLKEEFNISHLTIQIENGDLEFICLDEKLCN